MTLFDELAEKIGDDQWEAWKARVLDAKEEIAAFVASRRPGHGAEVLDWFQGSFNFCLQIMYNDGTPDALIRFPGPGHTTFRDEKIENEVQVIQFLQENTTIPVPRLISWGRTEDSPQHFGPFIISDFVEGVALSDILRDPADRKRIWLNPQSDGEILDNVFSQIADIVLQLYRFDFDHIGAISKDSSTGTWSVTRRPLTYSMNELATTALYPVDKFPTAPFASAREYFESLLSEQKTHLWTQRNLCGSPVEAKDRYISRHLFAQLVDRHCINDHGPFKLFCDDFRPQNILVDPTTLRIKAVLDLEFTNAMPSQYASEPPWWLLLVGPDSYVFRGRTIEEFVEAYEPRFEQFLQAMERAEKAREGLDGEKTLSCLMRESWASKRFWFNYATRKPFDVEVFYDGCLKEGSAGVELLDEEARAGLEPFVEMKMKQLKAYDNECANSL
ncbi:phosphotransferase enzyme family protein-like protein [Cucurbitaria berberidis CBS 394.84]|uniref:Phosphotransferase enzyme family protein-like protein n=1 Tax=Cucurbitaria berberidis CBS 394.84 TaxID=1168544 RepID=A0A9P4GLJ4_9PLEO|nr:phosphotransferase enzyme family protein-like protein [Cucurbitaria berberidis CBS 394.84]KAF1847815.1 phosphotransferase enzyme family protein-like protein [Cucurbitaria berberidis CBS 394.84]